MAIVYEFDYLSSEYFSSNKSETLFETGQNREINAYHFLDSMYIIFVFLLFVRHKVFEHKVNQDITISLVHFIFVAFSAILLPFLLVILFMFAIYRQMATIFLKIKLKSKFGGLLGGTDMVWAIEDVSKSIINILLIVEKEQNSEKLHAVVRRAIERNFFKNPERFPKLIATYHKAFGYYYLKKNDILLDDCVAILETHSEQDEIEKEELLKILSKISNDPLPRNHTTLWQVLVGKQSVRWRNEVHNERKKMFPIIFRIHHSLADAAALLKILIGTIADNSVKLEQKNVDEHKICSNRKPLIVVLDFFRKELTHLIKKVIVYAKTACVVISAPSKIILQTLRIPDQNVLHGPSLSGQKLLALKLEDSPCFIDMVKRIKSRLIGVTFSDVLLAAVSSSFRKYLKMNPGDETNFITAVVPVYQQISALLHGGTINRVLDNQFSVAMFTLPLKSKYGVDSINKISTVEILEMIKKERIALRDSNDYQVNYWLLSIVSALLPEPLLRPLLNSSQSTLIVSNVPGPPAITIFAGFPLENVVFWIPHRGTTGLGISILSYGGRLQIGLSVDKNLICKEAEAQDILNGMFNGLIEMDQELEDTAEDTV